jgi:hypothetical protein
MPSLTTQSIGVASSSLAPNTGANQVRATEAAQAAGVSKAQVQQLAQSSATKTIESRERVIQREKRSEGAFADREESETEQQSTEGAPPRHTGKLNTVA